MSSEEKTQATQNDTPTDAKTDTTTTTQGAKTPETPAATGNTEQAQKKDAPTASTARPAGQGATRGRGGASRGGGQKRNFRGRGRGARKERPKPDYDQKIISLRRVTRVMAGGRRFSFSVAMVIGDKRGRVGIGLAKANDTSFAIQKAFNDAKRNLVLLKLTDDHSLPYEVDAKFNAARINLRPNGSRGLVAGSSARTVLEYAGIKNVTARILSRSRNKINNARATLAALESFVVARGQGAQKKQKPRTENTKRDRGAASSSTRNAEKKSASASA